MPVSPGKGGAPDADRGRRQPFAGFRQGLLGGTEKTLTGSSGPPARWCLAEVCNVHSPAIGQYIHRVLFNVDCGAVL